MAADDVLWKKVDTLKTQSPTVSEDIPSRTEPLRKRASGRYPLSQSMHNGNGNSDPSPTTPGNTYGPSAGLDPTSRNNSSQVIQTVDRTAVRAYGLLAQVPARPAKRRPERYAFQFWADQITRLKKLRQVLNMVKDAEDREETTLSDLMREAVDEYLERATRTDSTVVRTGE